MWWQLLKVKVRRKLMPITKYPVGGGVEVGIAAISLDTGKVKLVIQYVADPDASVPDNRHSSTSSVYRSI